MSMTKTDKQALRDNANSIIGILENIAGYEASDIDGDNVELRFEDECGVDTGCDVSIVDQCQKTADVMRALLDELEAKDKRIAELEARTLTVKLPSKFSLKLAGDKSTKAYFSGINEGIDDTTKAFSEAIRAAGIALDTGE